RSHEGSTGDLVVTDVVNLQSTRCHVAQDHVGFAKAAEIAEASNLPVQTDRAHEGGVDDGVVADVVDLECAGAGIAQHHVGHAVRVEVADTRRLPIQAHSA